MDGKKLLVLSDTHGHLPALKAVFDWAKNYTPPNDTICAVAFLGDGISDLNRAANASGFYSDWKLIRGNNDYEPSVPDSAVFDFADYKFYMCHGHRHSLYGGYHGLAAAARGNGAGIVLFGHTHVPVYKTENGIILINPGSVGRPRSRIGASFAVIDCVPEEMLKVDFWGIGDRGSILKLKLP